MIPPNIVEDQFILTALTGVASGQNAKNHTGAKNSTAAILIGKPNLPNDHLRGGKGHPRVLLQMRQLMVMKYELRMETPPRELIALRAVEEPRLMHARRVQMTSDTHTARRGIFQPGVT